MKKSNKSISEQIIDVSEPKINEDTSKVSPIQSASSLFNFMRQMDDLMNVLKDGFIAPKYVVEDIKYIGIEKVEEIAIAMRCFCDINMHMLADHINWYGNYSIAFSKDFGKKNNFQPIHYINPDGQFVKEYREAFSVALSLKNDDKQVEILKNQISNQLLFMKPDFGTQRYPSEGEKVKCFTDDNEWRYVPETSSLPQNMDVILTKIPDEEMMKLWNKALRNKDCSVEFKYEDIKYIIIKEKNERKIISNFLDYRKITGEERDNFFSKVIVWDEIKDDL